MGEKPCLLSAEVGEERPASLPAAMRVWMVLDVSLKRLCVVCASERTPALERRDDSCRVANVEGGGGSKRLRGWLGGGGGVATEAASSDCSKACAWRGSDVRG